MHAAYSVYPPKIADDVKTIEERDGGRPAYVLASSTTGRQILIHATEYQVVRLLERSLSPREICAEFERENGRALSLNVLAKFLTKLGEAGTLCGMLETKRVQFELIAPRSGMVFGEELLRMVGQYFTKGAEICSIAETSELLVRIQVPEREIGGVRIGHAVRLKTRAYADLVFRGVVSKIGNESEPDEHGASHLSRRADH